MTRVPWWGLLSAAAAPVLLVGGWTLAAHLQPGGFDPVHDTISALAARDAADRWVMTAALLGLGLCHVVTACALRPASPAGRLGLAVGGVATLAVAAFPLPSGDARSAAHSAAAGVAFAALTAWPAAAPRSNGAGDQPFVLRRATGVAATLVLAGLLGWFVLELGGGGDRLGLSERVVAGAQALWPLVVVVSLRTSRRATSPETAVHG